MAKHLDDTQGHPILRFLDVLSKGLDEIAETPAWSLTTTETTQVVTRLEAELARLAEVEARALTQAETLDLHGAAGAKSIAVWLAMTTRLTRTEAERRTRLAKQLAAHDQTREAMGAGAVLPQQAMVITKAVDALDNTQHRDAAEGHLIKEAAHFDAHKLAELGRRILETVDPDKADAHEAKLLEKQEAGAREEDPVPDLRRRRRPVPRPVHDADRAGRDAAQSPPSPGRSEARPGHRGRRVLRLREAHPGEAGQGVLRVRRAVPRRPAPRHGWHQRHDHRDRRRLRCSRVPTRQRTSTPATPSPPGSSAAGRARRRSCPP